MFCLTRRRKKVGPAPPPLNTDDVEIDILTVEGALKLFESHVEKYREHLCLVFMGLRGDMKLHYTYEIHERFALLQDALRKDLISLENHAYGVDEMDEIVGECRKKVEDLGAIYKLKMYQAYIEDTLVLDAGLQRDPIVRRALTFDVFEGF